MTSFGLKKSNFSFKHSTKCRSRHPNSSLSLNGTQLSIENNEMNSSENATSSTTINPIERIHKHHKILSSTLKHEYSTTSNKRRSRFEKLFQYTKIINQQYMMTMTNILFKMQKEIFKIKTRTHRIERAVDEQINSTKPIIRIPRLTQDQLSTICSETHHTISHEGETMYDTNNNDIEALPDAKMKSTKNKTKHGKNTTNHGKKSRTQIWINNRQKPIDLNRYCSSCQREFSKRSNFLTHIKNVHKGKLPHTTNEQDQSLSEMNDDSNTRKAHLESTDIMSNEMTNDQAVVIVNDEIQSNNDVIKQCDIGKIRLRSRTNAQHFSESLPRVKVKCDICHKFYQAEYIKKHKIRAHHSDQEISSTSLSSEIQDNLNQIEPIFEKENNQCDASNKHPQSISETEISITDTSTEVTIAEMETEDLPILFSNEATKSIIIAVTCLENYQLDLVSQFVEKFSPQVRQVTSIDSQTTHLVTNDERQSLRSPLSMKLIEAIAHHCFCVSYRWIIECLKYDRIIDEEVFEIDGDDTEVQPHGGPKRSRLIQSQHSLFRNICFMIKCTENSDIRMTNQRLEDLIVTCGGQIITCVTQRLLDKYQIVVLCDVAYVSERRHNYDQCRSLGIHFVSSDWVLESILEYRTKPFTLFEEVPF